MASNLLTKLLKYNLHLRNTNTKGKQGKEERERERWRWNWWSSAYKPPLKAETASRNGGGSDGVSSACLLSSPTLSFAASSPAASSSLPYSSKFPTFFSVCFPRNPCPKSNKTAAKLLDFKEIRLLDDVN